MVLMGALFKKQEKQMVTVESSKKDTLVKAKFPAFAAAVIFLLLLSLSLVPYRLMNEREDEKLNCRYAGGDSQCRP